MADISTYKSSNSARNIAILRAYLNGMSMREIGLSYHDTPLTPTTVRVVINKIMCHLYDRPTTKVDPRYTHPNHVVRRLDFPFTAGQIRAMKDDILSRLDNPCPHSASAEVQNKKERGTEFAVKIHTWYRRSTKEWVGEIEYHNRKVNGLSRYTGKTEREAMTAALACVGKDLLAATFE